MITNGKIKPLPNNVIIRDINIGEKVSNGIIVLNDDGKERGIKPRECIVYAVGENVDYVVPGDKILVAHGRWTRGVELNDGQEVVKIHMVDTKDIMLVFDE